MLLAELQTYLRQLMQVDSFNDYCPNGLQVEGRAEINKIVSGVTACQALLEAAVARQADAVLVHHGYFWKGENPCVVGMKQRRLSCLLENKMSLLAYHLPLDALPEMGNNAQLAQRLAFTITGELDTGPGPKFGLVGKLAQPYSAANLQSQIATQLGRDVLYLPGNDKPIKIIAWCSGGAQDYIEQAVKQGCDAYLTGEVSERTTHVARECGIHFFAAGHHATERYGVQALGQHLQAKFGIDVEFVDIDNPV